MDKYEYKVRAEEIKELIAQEEYAQAADIADTIDWRRVKSVMMLCTISDLYKINRRYEDARDMLLLAYERRPGGRTICYSLCELSIKLEEFVQAVEYYKEFVQVAPKDAGRFVLQYKLYEAQDVSLEERIEVLEELKKRDYREKWAYELAYLYHRVGLATRCVEECDELILWFGEGKYVIKAMELKMLHQPLSAKQQEKYDRRFQSAAYAEETGYTAQSQAVAQPVQSAAPVHTYMTQTDLNADTIVYDRDQLNAQINAQINAQANVAMNVQPEEQLYVPEEVQEYAAEEVQEYAEAPVEEVAGEEFDIQVKTLDMGQYNTMNLQAELAAGLREVLGDNVSGSENPITQSIIAPMMASDDTETLDYPQIDEISEDDLGPEQEEMEDSEVFFGETGEIMTDDYSVYGANEEPAEYEATEGYAGYEYAEPEAAAEAGYEYAEPEVAEEAGYEYAEPVAAEETGYEYAEPEVAEEAGYEYTESVAAETTGYEYAEPVETDEAYEEATEDFGEIEKEPTVYEKAVRSLDTEFMPYEETVADYATREINIPAEALAAYAVPEMDTWQTEDEPETIEELITEEILEDMAEEAEAVEAEEAQMPAEDTYEVPVQEEVYEAPVEEVYEAEGPAYEAPVEETYEAEEPAYEAPVEETYEVVEPAYEAPVEETYEAEESVYEAPVEETYEVEEPAYEAPVEETYEAEESVYEAPVEETYEAEEPAYEASVEETYEAEEPAYEAPVEETYGVEESVDEAPVEEDKDFTAEIVMEQMRRENSGEMEDEALYAEPPKEIASILSQEDDGQIGLVVPESELIEKQITGQMNLEDILAEWERVKQENEEKRKEEIRQHVLQQTDNMFTEFEASVRDGLLEQIENGEISVEEAVAVSEGMVEDTTLEEPVETEDFFSENEEDLEIIDDLDEEINNGESLGGLVDIVEMVTGEIDAKAVAAATLGTTALGAAAFGSELFEAEDEVEEIAEEPAVEAYASYAEPVAEEYASYEEPAVEEYTSYEVPVEEYVSYEAPIVEEPVAETAYTVEEAAVAEEFASFEQAADEVEEIAEEPVAEAYASFEEPAVEEYTSYEVPVEEYVSYEAPIVEEPVAETAYTVEEATVTEEFASFEQAADEVEEIAEEPAVELYARYAEPVAEEYVSYEEPATEEHISYEEPVAEPEYTVEEAAVTEEFASFEQAAEEVEEIAEEPVAEAYASYEEPAVESYASYEEPTVEEYTSYEVPVEEYVSYEEPVVEESATETAYAVEEPVVESAYTAEEPAVTEEFVSFEQMEDELDEIAEETVAEAYEGYKELITEAYEGFEASVTEDAYAVEVPVATEEFVSYAGPVEETVEELASFEVPVTENVEEFVSFEVPEEEFVSFEVPEDDDYVSYQVPTSGEGPVYTAFEVGDADVRDEVVETFVAMEEPVEEIIVEATTEATEEVIVEAVEESVEEAVIEEATEPAEEVVVETVEEVVDETVEEVDADTVEEDADEAIEETVAEEEVVEEADATDVEEEIAAVADEQEEDDGEQDFAYISDVDTEESVEGEQSAEETKEEVETEQEVLRELTKEEKELYAPFIQSKAGKEQIIKALDNISMASYTGNLVVTGEEGVDTIGLAKNIIREIQMNDRNFSGKVAKISGEALNRKDVEEILANLKNGALIVQKANEMEDETVETLYKSLQQESTGIIVVIEGTKRNINKFLSQQEALAECFTARVDVEALNNDTLVAFGRQYAREREYSIDEFGVLALHTRIEDLQTSDHNVTVVDVKGIVDEAIERANKKSVASFFNTLFAKRYDSEDMIILTEKDFAK